MNPFISYENELEPLVTPDRVVAEARNHAASA